MTDAPRKKKLIEVALPLEEINAACKADKDRTIGTIRNLHKWFAPAPLPAWRALLFAALIDDPGDDLRRAELHDLIKQLVASGADLPDLSVVDEAKQVIQEQFPQGLPMVLDPFCGGGSTLVEAQRLGLETFGTDLNPVPVVITRTLTELLPKVVGQQPLNPEPARSKRGGRVDREGEQLSATHVARRYEGYDGLTRDVLFYAESIRESAWQAISGAYPIPTGEEPIAWLWARTVRCPNPACLIETILTTTWWLSQKTGDLAWIEPVSRGDHIELQIVSGRSSGSPQAAPKVGRGASFVCLNCSGVITEEWIDKQAAAGGLGLRMTAVDFMIENRRQYRPPNEAEIAAAARLTVDPDGLDAIPVSDGGTRRRFGLVTQADLYTPRQLLTLMTFADKVAELHSRVIADGGTEEWADAVTTLLALSVGKMSQYCSSQTRVEHGHGGWNRFHPAFARNDLPMTWGFAEIFPFGDYGANFMQFVDTMVRAIVRAPSGSGVAKRADARTIELAEPGLVATDPPYFDAIGYADLSDYFYVWHRRALRNVHPDLYATVAAPKSGELTAIQTHHDGSREAARNYFIEGFTATFRNLKRSLRDDLPMLVIYASKEQQSGRGEETRWESILTSMVNADLEITGTWPIHMTSKTRMISIGTNAVASYVVLVCRPRSASASTTSLSDFSRALRRELPTAIRDLQASSILPVDLYQAALGPGMQIYSRYRKVEDSHGERVAVGRALELITGAVGSVLDEQEGELDSASRFAVTWWEQHGWQSGPFGDADKVARGYGTHVDDVVRSVVATALPGKGVQLLGVEALDRAWTPASDAQPTAWEAAHHLADRLINGGGESEAAALLAQLGDLQDSTRTLAYRLHDIAAKKGWAKDQERYNALIGQWSSMLALAATHNPEGLF